MAQAVILARYLGAENYGRWSMAIAVPAAVSFLTDIGLNSVMLRSIAAGRGEQEAIIPRVAVCKIPLCLLFVAIVTGVSLCGGHGASVVWLTFTAALASVAIVPTELVIAVKRAREDFKFEAWVMVVRDLGTVCVTIALLLAHFGVQVVMTVTAVLSAVYSVALWHRHMDKGIWAQQVPLRVEYYKLIKSALPFAGYSFLGPLFLQVNVILLGTLGASLSTVGDYNSAYRFILFAYFLPTALQRTLFPRLTSLANTKDGQYERTLEYAVGLSLLIGIPGACGLMSVADGLITHTFGPEFVASSRILSLLALTIPLYSVRVVCSISLYASGMEMLVLRGLAACVILNVILDLFLIPRFGGMGAAAGAVISELAVTLCYVIPLLSKFRAGWMVWVLGKIAACCGLMLLVLHVAAPLNVFVRVALGGLTFVAAFGCLDHWLRRDCGFDWYGLLRPKAAHR
jgi:O-antigen/teichoic acid export membrane protein